MDLSKEYCNVREASRILNKNRHVIRYLIDNGDLNTYGIIGKNTLLKRSEVIAHRDALLSTNKEPA